MLTLTALIYNAKIMPEAQEVLMFGAISTACLYPLETEKALSELLRQGVRSFEVFANCESEFSDSFTKEILSMVKSYDAKICSVHLYTCGLEPFMFFSNYPRRFDDAAEQYKHYFERAAYLGASDVVFHGDRKDSTIPHDIFCERFSALAEIARAEGVVLAQENVARCRSGQIENVKAMKKSLGKDVRFVLDVKQALRAGIDPIDMCDAMGENIDCVHLSDSTKEHDCLLPGQGSYDFKPLISHLRSFSFSGPLTIEVYRCNYSVYSELYDSLSFINSLLQ